MGWYKVHKTFRNGQYPEKDGMAEYIEVPKGTKKDDVKDYAEDWAERAEGGHNYGYKVFWKRVSKPSQLWLKKERDKEMESIRITRDYIKRLELMLNH